mmetsp:Transcript_7928/g.18320  ORF Transcript_7928/g.18320 Transcript_7928/m.18320 type:complete len:89 (+) Transcript_7928:45-311(+)
MATAAAAQGLGFLTTGILKGSAAATMMSQEAIALNGGVVAGGKVAMLQSLGAKGAVVTAGTGSVLLTVLAAGGVVVGVSYVIASRRCT